MRRVLMIDFYKQGKERVTGVWASKSRFLMRGGLEEFGGWAKGRKVNFLGGT
jgi:hypothetical protein